MYSAAHGFWPVEKLAELAEGLSVVVQWRSVGV